jgi:multiple RNA-binding domain-containing protein 1
MAVRLALAETQIVNETKEFFEKHGIVLDSFGKKERSETIILVKNIPYGTTEDEMRELFGKYGELGRVSDMTLVWLLAANTLNRSLCHQPRQLQ